MWEFPLFLNERWEDGDLWMVGDSSPHCGSLPALHHRTFDRSAEPLILNFNPKWKMYKQRVLNNTVPNSDPGIWGIRTKQHQAEQTDISVIQLLSTLMRFTSRGHCPSYFSLGANQRSVGSLIGLISHCLIYKKSKGMTIFVIGVMQSPFLF